MGKKRPGGYRLLGTELRRLRGHRSLRQIEELSHSAPFNARVEPLSASTLHKIESGERKPRMETLLTLSALYQIPPARLLTLMQIEGLWSIRPEGDDFEKLREEAAEAFRLGDYRKCYGWALRLEELACDGKERAVALGDKGISLWKLGLPREGAAELTELLADPHLDLWTQANAWFNLAAIHRALWNLPVAQACVQTALPLARRAGSTELLAHIERALGNIKSDLGGEADGHDGRLFREAIRHFEHSSELFEKAGRPERAALNVSNIGVAHVLEGNLLLGFRRLREGLELCREAGNQRAVAFTLKELGKALGASGEWGRARKHLLEADAIASAQGYDDLQFQVLYHLMEGEKQQGGAARHVMRRLLALKPFVQSRFPEMESFEAMVQVKVAQGGMR